MRTPIVTQRFNKLADTLADLKVKVRTALAAELASAVGIAVRDILVVAMIDQMIATPSRPATRTPPSHTGWRDDEGERDRWGEPKDPWADPDEDEVHRDRMYSRSGYRERDEEVSTPTVPTAAAIAIGVNVGRWWLARRGTTVSAIGIGVLATALGLAGGPFARAALAVLAAATDVLTAESALARVDPS